VPTDIFAQQLAGPTNLRYSCSYLANGTARATAAWNAVTGAVGYRANFNRAPQADWVGPGDFAVDGITTLSTTQNVSSATTYFWDVQGKRAGETYPYTGIRSFSTLSCPFPAPTFVRVGTCSYAPFNQEYYISTTEVNLVPGAWGYRFILSPIGDISDGSGIISYGIGRGWGGRSLTLQVAAETGPGQNVGAFASRTITCPHPTPGSVPNFVGTCNYTLDQVQFSWGAATNAATYDITVVNNTNNLMYSTTTSARAYSVGPIWPRPSNWQAWVTPRNISGTSGPAASTTFTCSGPSATPRPSNTPTLRPPTGTRTPTPRPPTGTRTPTPRPPTGTPTRSPGTNTPTQRPATSTPTRIRTGTPTPTTCVISGTVNLSPSTSTTAPGNSQQFEAVISGLSACGNTVQVNFSSNNTAVANVSPTSDTTARYQTTATVATGATSGEQATIRADVIIGGITRFSDTSRITVGGQSCDFDLTPATASIGTGATQILQVSNITQNGVIEEVQFSSSDATIVSVSPGVDSSPTYRTTATGNTIGTATITADMIMDGVSVCSNSAEVTVTGSTPWWQVIESDVITNGDIVSEIPSSCTAAVSCTNSIITEGSGNNSGVASAGNNINAGTGTVSESNNWQASSSYNGPTYNYDYFEDRSSCGTFSTLGSSTVDSLSDLTSGTQSSGYYWKRYTGSTLTISSNISLGDNKVILFVDGDLRIEGRITFNDGTGFFMVVVSGDIIVEPSVGGSADSSPDLEGIYYTDEQFRTGTNGIGADEQLHIRGSVAAFDRIVLERSTPNDATAPAELFEYAPETLLRLPTCIGERSVEWRELAP
jgi:hypothetical protein